MANGLKETKIVIFGAYDSGKTTTLDYLCDKKLKIDNKTSHQTTSNLVTVSVTFLQLFPLDLGQLCPVLYYVPALPFLTADHPDTCTSFPIIHPLTTRADDR